MTSQNNQGGKANDMEQSVEEFATELELAVTGFAWWVKKSTRDQVKDVIRNYRDALLAEREAEVRRDERKALLDEVCGVLNSLKRTKIEWSGTTDEQKNQLLAIFDAHNEALSDAKTAVRKLLS